MFRLFAISPPKFPRMQERSSRAHRAIGAFGSPGLASASALVTAVALSGCGLHPPPPDLVQRIQQSTPYCHTGSDCDVKWEATQLWVSRNTPNKIRLANGTLIETERNPDGVNLEMKAEKVPLGSGRYELRMDVSCETLLGCSPTPHEALHAYHLYMASFDANATDSASPKERILDSLAQLSEVRNRYLADSILNASPR
jgi:hypothetical protein